MNVRLIARFVVLGLLTAGLSALTPEASAAAGQRITVSTPKDLVDGTDGRCSLREALNAAANNAPSGDAKGECTAGGSAEEDLIQLKADTVYKLTRDGATDEDANSDGDLDVVSGSVQIRGRKGTVIAQRDGDQRVIDVRDAADLSLHRIKATGGHLQPAGEGGGIRNRGKLTMSRCTVSGNSAGSAPTGSGRNGGRGGGIYNIGILALKDSKVANNTAGDGANKGLTVGPGDGGYGGGIYNALLVHIVNSKLLNNRAGNGGHGTSSGVALGTKGASGGRGGALMNRGTAIIERSTLTGNRTGDGGDGGRGGQTLDGEGLDGADGGNAGGGGAIDADSTGSIEIVDSTISGNSTGQGGRGGPGGFGSPSGGPGSDGRDGKGGGIETWSESKLANVTISGNTAGGGGGGMFAMSDVELNNVTIARNASPNGMGGGVLQDGNFSLYNTLIADNHAQVSPDCRGPFDANAYNLVENPDGCTGLSGTDITGVDPRLARLDANGGPTETHALRRRSPAIDAGSAATPTGALPACEVNDQRGKPRSDCDIGAYERV